MRLFRTIVYTLLILGIATVLMVKHVRRTHAPTGTSPAASAIADACAHHLPVWLLIHSTSCHECQEMRRVCHQLGPEFKGKVCFVEVEYDDRSEQDLIRGYNVRLVPTSVFLKSDGALFEKKIGAMTADQARAVLKRLMRTCRD